MKLEPTRPDVRTTAPRRARHGHGTADTTRETEETIIILYISINLFESPRGTEVSLASRGLARTVEELESQSASCTSIVFSDHGYVSCFTEILA